MPNLKQDKLLRPDWTVLALALGFVVAFVLATGYLVTRSPWWDEGLFADVALNFRNYGHFGSSVLDPDGYLHWPEVHRYTYWQFPLYLVTLGTWFHIFQGTVRWMRVLSLVWSCVYVFSWYVLVRAWSRNKRLALFLACIVGLDYWLINAASDGRMEMMCAGLGYAGMASYVSMRETRWTMAIAAASFFGAASLFCHPMGAMMNASIAALILIDWRFIRWGRMWIACIPYALGFLFCALYIMQAPKIFDAQYHAATDYRVRTAATIAKSVFRDAYQRYWVNFFLVQTGINKARVVIFAFAVIETIAVAADAELRKETVARRLLLLALIAYIGVAVIDNRGFPFYMVYSMPVMTGCAAFWVYARWHHSGVRRLLPAAFLAVSLAIIVGGYSLKIVSNGYSKLFRPAITLAEKYRKPGGVIMGGSELAFVLGFHSRELVDDRYLGYFSGTKPDVYVESQYYYAMPGPVLTKAWNVSRQRLHDEYHLVFQNVDYRIYARNDNSDTIRISDRSSTALNR